MTVKDSFYRKCLNQTVMFLRLSAMGAIHIIQTVIQHGLMVGRSKLFLGKYSGTLNKNGRLLTPASYGNQLSGGVYITQGFERNLLVLPPTAFEEIYRRVCSQNIADPLARMLQRLMLGTASLLESGAGGAITIPEELRSFAGLSHGVLLVGQGDYFEIWQPELWESQEIQLRDARANASRFSTLTVTTR